MRHVQSLQHHQGPTGYPRPRRGHARPHGQPADAARRLSRLFRSDRPHRGGRRARTRHGALGHAVAGLRYRRQEDRSWRHHIRNVKSSHWRRWLGVESRCIVPFTSFAENEVLPDGSRPPVWFAFDDSRPLAFFAGIWTRWTSVRKVREGETTNDLFGFLTTVPNAIVGAVHEGHARHSDQTRRNRDVGCQPRRHRP